MSITKPELTSDILRGLQALRNLGEHELDNVSITKTYKELIEAATEWIDLMSVYKAHKRDMAKLQPGLDTLKKAEEIIAKAESDS